MASEYKVLEIKEQFLPLLLAVPFAMVTDQIVNVSKRPGAFILRYTTYVIKKHYILQTTVVITFNHPIVKNNYSVLSLFPRQQNSAYLLLYTQACRLWVFLLIGITIAKMISLPQFHNCEDESL